MFVEWLINLMLLAVGVLGNTWLWTAYTNRVYSLPIPCRRLDQFRKLHDFAMVLVPFILLGSLVQISLGDYELVAAVVVLTNFGWWTVFWALSLFGFGGLILTLLTRLLRVKPPGYKFASQNIIDVEKELGYQPVGEGPYQKLLKVPGNQAFTFEMNEKQFVFPELHDELHELTILHLSDLHFIGTIDRVYFEMVCQRAANWNPDLIVFTGDLLDQQELVSWLPSTLGKLKARLGCYYILGNHDWHLDCEPIRNQLQELGWQDCAGSVKTVQHRTGTIHIGGDERPWMGDAPAFDSSQNDAFKLLLSHTPDNFAWAKQQGVDLMLSGHNHGGQVKLPVIGPLYSPSKFGVRYADGEFYSSPTTLHVSRGVSGRHPLRINCRPEITLIHIQQDIKTTEVITASDAKNQSEETLLKT